MDSVGNRGPGGSRVLPLRLFPPEIAHRTVKEVLSPRALGKPTMSKNEKSQRSSKAGTMQNLLMPQSRRAIVRDNGIRRPAQFAERMWLDAKAWQRVGKCGAYGPTRAIGLRFGAKGYRGRLRKAGLITGCYSITQQARALLELE